MDRAFEYAGWDNFTNITESGSHLLTMEFLMTLNIVHLPRETQIRFRFFNEEFLMTPKEMSIALGFNKRSFLDPDALIRSHRYDRNVWWDTISDDPVGSKNSITYIHNPTLRFLAKWLVMNVHPHADLRLCNNPDLLCLFAFAKKIRYSPVMSLLDYWQKLVHVRSSIDITSLVTRIAVHAGVLTGNAQVTYLPMTQEYFSCIGLDHFVQGHLMREDENGTLYMCYPGYDVEVELPNSNLSLYSVKSLTLQMRLREPARHSVADPPLTRGRARRATGGEAGTSRPPEPSSLTDIPLHRDPATADMNFEQAYDYYGQQGGSYGMYEQGPGFHYTLGMSFGPNAGPFSSARFDYEDPITRELSRLNNQIGVISQEQQRLRDEIAHNTDLTQQSWGMASAMHFDISSVFRRMNLDGDQQY
jgi:hypothetical protein